jgi:hypothetical protein
MDAAYQDRQQFIAKTWPHSSLEAKRERALKVLGDKWVLHRKWAVKRKDQLAKEQT